MRWITELLREKLLAREIEGDRVIRTPYPISVQSVDPSGRLIRLAAPGFEATLEARLNGGESHVELQSSALGKPIHYAGLSQRDAVALHEQLFEQLVKSPPASVGKGASTLGGKLKTAIVAALAVWFILWLPLPSGSGVAQGPHAMQQSQAALAQVPSSQAIAPSPAPKAVPRASAQEMAGLAALAVTSGVKLTGDGKPFYVFSDPKCPFCRQLEGTLEALGTNSGFQAVILPVAYKDGSKEVVSGVLCSKDAAGAWVAALREGAGQKASPACVDGDKKVAANMAMFEQMSLNSTPVIVTPNGTLIAGSGDADPLKLRAVLAAN